MSRRKTQIYYLGTDPKEWVYKFVPNAVGMGWQLISREDQSVKSITTMAHETITKGLINLSYTMEEVDDNSVSHQ